MEAFFLVGDKVFNINKSDDPCSNKKQVNISIFHTPYKDTIKLGDTLKVKIESFFSEFNNPLIRLDTDSLDVPVELFISEIHQILFGLMTNTLIFIKFMVILFLTNYLI